MHDHNKIVIILHSSTLLVLLGFKVYVLLFIFTILIPGVVFFDELSRSYNVRAAQLFLIFKNCLFDPYFPMIQHAKHVWEKTQKKYRCRDTEAVEFVQPGSGVQSGLDHTPKRGLFRFWGRCNERTNNGNTPRHGWNMYARINVLLTRVVGNIKRV